MSAAARRASLLTTSVSRAPAVSAAARRAGLLTTSGLSVVLRQCRLLLEQPVYSRRLSVVLRQCRLLLDEPVYSRRLSVVLRQCRLLLDKPVYSRRLSVALRSVSELECSLSSDMVRMSHFCRQWRLKPSASKTEKRGVFAFHYLLTFLHDAYSGINGLLTPFVGVECNCGSTTVLGSHAKKINIDITELLYR